MATVDIESIKPNSNKYKEEQAKKERDRLEPVIKGDHIVSTKKPLSQKFKDTFISKEASDIKTYIVRDVIIPGITDTVLDIISLALKGETYTGGRRGNRYDSGRTNYRASYRGSSYRSNDSEWRRSSSYRRDDRDHYQDTNNRLDYRNVIVRYREDAESIVDTMKRRIIDTGSVSIAEMFDLIDVAGRFTDNNWGWTDERDIGLRRVSSGYLIDVAEARPLND